MQMRTRVMIPVVIEDVNDLESIERGMVEARRRLPSCVMQEVVDQVERIAMSQDPGRLRKKDVESRRVWTLCGCAEFVRTRYEDDLEEKSYRLFDLRTGLAPRLQMTPAAQRMFSNLAAISPSYEKARQETELLWGDAPSTATIWSYTQREGAALRKRAEAKRKALLEDGELPETRAPAKDFVGIETDVIMVDEWRTRNKHHAVHVGIAYDGKRYRGKKRRPELTNKVATASLDGSKSFGIDMFLTAHEAHNFMDAQVVHYASDGEEALETIRLDHFPMAGHQLDHHHVTSRAYDAYGWDNKEAAGQILGHIFSEKRHEFELAIREDIRRFRKRSAKLAEYRDYILQRWEWIFAARRLAREKPHLEIPKHISGSGAEERMVGVLVSHRMKHRGMGWTKDGAANIVLIRIRALGFQHS